MPTDKLRLAGFYPEELRSIFAGTDWGKQSTTDGRILEACMGWSWSWWPMYCSLRWMALDEGIDPDDYEAAEAKRGGGG